MSSLLENFMDNTEIFRGDENRIDQAAFDTLISEHGFEVARGYIKAMREMAGILNNILMTESGRGVYLRSTPATIVGKVSNLHIVLFDFLKSNDVDVDELQTPFPSRTRLRNF